MVSVITDSKSTSWLTSTSSIVAQLAKLDGLKVIGSTGSDAKVKYLKDELGLDYAFNYKSESVDEALSNAGPVDIYYDNVGGATLEAAIDHLNDWSRIIVCTTMAIATVWLSF